MRAELRHSNKILKMGLDITQKDERRINTNLSEQKLQNGDSLRE
jgi:hypothetical protein